MAFHVRNHTRFTQSINLPGRGPVDVPAGGEARVEGDDVEEVHAAYAGQGAVLVDADVPEAPAAPLVFVREAAPKDEAEEPEAEEPKSKSKPAAKGEAEEDEEKPAVHHRRAEEHPRRRRAAED